MHFCIARIFASEGMYIALRTQVYAYYDPE